MHVFALLIKDIQFQNKQIWKDEQNQAIIYFIIKNRRRVIKFKQTHF